MIDKSSKRPRCRCILLSLVAAIVGLTMFVAVVLAYGNSVTIDGDVTGDWDDELCVVDEGGQNDSSAWTDLTRFCAASNYTDTQPADILYVRWDWDETGFPGQNTGDGCVLFDADSDGNIDRALCVTIHQNPAEVKETNLYSCDDTKPDRCSGASPITFNGSCMLDNDANTNPWGDNPDAAIECSLPITDTGQSPGDTLLEDATAFPSSSPNSNPSDDVLEGNSASRLAVNTSNGNNYPTDEFGNPTAITLVSFSAGSPDTSLMPSAFLTALIAAGLMSVWTLWVRHRR